MDTQCLQRALFTPVCAALSGMDPLEEADIARRLSIYSEIKLKNNVQLSFKLKLFFTFFLVEYNMFGMASY